MSRRLLIEDYNNELMPVMDGLVCWLDGRDYDGGDTVKDRIKGKEFTAQNISVSGYSFWYNNNPNSIMFSKVNEDEELYNLFNSDFTLCCTDKLSKYLGSGEYSRLFNFCQYSLNSPYQLIYYPEKNCMQSAYRSSNTFNTLSNINIHKNLNKKNFVIVKRGIDIIIYLDGIEYERTIDDITPNINLTRVTLGQAYNSTSARVYKGHICSFMCYNRALTEEEIKQNYEYEKSIERGE